VQTFLLFISADAAQEKEKKEKKVLLPTGGSKCAAQTVLLVTIKFWILFHAVVSNCNSYKMRIFIAHVSYSHVICSLDVLDVLPLRVSLEPNLKVKRIS
jgi:hypothetical protein